MADLCDFLCNVDRHMKKKPHKDFKRTCDQRWYLKIILIVWLLRENGYCSFLYRWITDSSSWIFRTPLFAILDSWSSTLESRILKLKRLDLRYVRIKFRGSSWDCQLTFEQYCTILILVIISRTPSVIRIFYAYQINTSSSLILVYRTKNFTAGFVFYC